MIGTRKRGKSLTTRRTEAEEELNIIGLKNKQAIVRDYWERRKTVLEAKIRKDYNA
jgi:hypothetical protein